MKKNGGFSLIELLVAIAISGIVILMISFIMVQGTTLFKGENEVIDLQGELQIVRNQLSEAIMGAKSVVVVETSGEENKDMIIYTGEVDKETNKLAVQSSGGTLTTERVIAYVDGALYISTDRNDVVSEGNLISKYVSGMKIEFNESSKVVDDAGRIHYKNPFSVDITITLQNGDHKSDITMNVRARNILEKVAWYEVGDLSDLLKSAKTESEYSVSR